MLQKGANLTFAVHYATFTLEFTFQTHYKILKHS